MNFNKKLATAVSGAVLLMAGQFALADSTTDIVDALVSKGVLTEEEGKLITKGSETKRKAEEKANKSRISVGSFIDNATMYGDIRVRHEYRAATDSATGEQVDTNRERYKVTLGIKTEAKNWYSDLALAMGSKGRSDNATFGGESNTVGSNGYAYKEALYVKRAMIGWKATDWLSLEAGRIANPLYTTPMVWDADLTFDGATAKANFKTGESSIFLTAAAFQYLGYDKQYSGSSRDRTTNNIGVIQAGFDTPVTSELSAKAAVTYYNYGRGNTNWTYGVSDTNTGTTNLNIIEVPAELNYKVSSTGKIKLYGDWVINTDADARASRANSGAGDTTSAKDDDTAWLLGIEYKNQKDKKPSEGDFKAAIWYQETGLYALDPNAVDSDFFDSKINVQGAVVKGEYLVSDNVYLNAAYGHGTRKNKAQLVSGITGDTGYAFSDFDLLQLDLTYKF